MRGPGPGVSPALRRHRVRLWGRYTGASVIAGLISEAVFLLTYWLAGAPLLASVLAFGLAIGTLLTLGVVPVLYCLVFRVRKPLNTAAERV